MGGFFSSLGKMFTGSPSKVKNVSTLRKEQEPLYQQLVNAGMQQGAGGAFGTAADYYRNLLSDNPADLAAYTAPAMRQFSQDILPGIEEQFAGMGSGGLSSSGFRNAATQGATDLAERIAAIRANLRQAGAAGLQNIGSQGLQSYQNQYTIPGTPGLIETMGPAVGTALAGAVGGPFGAMLGSGLGSMASNWFGNKGSQVSGNPQVNAGLTAKASPTMGNYSPSNWNPPQFMQR